MFYAKLIQAIIKILKHKSALATLYYKIADLSIIKLSYIAFFYQTKI